MHADALGLVQRAGRFGIVDEFAAERVGAEQFGRVAEHVLPHLRLGGEPLHDARPMRDQEMAARLRIAIDLRDERLEGIEALVDLVMHLERDILAPALDPLRAREPSRRVLPLSAVAARAAPAHLVRFQHDGLDAMLAREKQRRRESGVAAADDRDIDVDVLRDRAVVGRRGAGRRGPVGRRVLLALTGAGRHERIVSRVVARVDARFASERTRRIQVDRTVFHASLLEIRQFASDVPCGTRASPRSGRRGIRTGRNLQPRCASLRHACR